MKHNSRKTLFETSFADNFQPSWWEKMVMKWEVFRRDVMQDLLPTRGQVLVDLACGDGELLIANAKRYHTLIGFDISTVRIKNARKRMRQLGVTIQLNVADLDTGIPLKTSSVDAVTCEAALNYFLRPDVTIEEVHRILKKHGVLVVQVGNYAFITRRLALLRGRLPKLSSFKGFGDGGMLHYFTYQTLQELLETKGFRVINQTNSGVLAHFRSWWPQLLASDIIMVAQKK